MWGREAAVSSHRGAGTKGGRDADDRGERREGPPEVRELPSFETREVPEDYTTAQHPHEMNRKEINQSATSR